MATNGSKTAARTTPSTMATTFQVSASAVGVVAVLFQMCASAVVVPASEFVMALISQLYAAAVGAASKGGDNGAMRVLDTCIRIHNVMYFI